MSAPQALQAAGVPTSPPSYQGVPDVQVADPAAHIAVLGEFLHVVRA